MYVTGLYKKGWKKFFNYYLNKIFRKYWGKGDYYYDKYMRN